MENQNSVVNKNLPNMQLVKNLSPVKRPRRDKPITCQVVHTTGDTDLEKIVRYYLKTIGPHFLIDYDGTITQFVETDRVAWHCGFQGDGPDNEGELYEKGWEVWSRRIDKSPWKVEDPYPGYETWRKRWPDFQSPIELVSGRYPNFVSIGIEVREPERRQPAKFFDAQYEALAELLKFNAANHQLILDRDHVLGHYDVNPIARCGPEGDRDPGEAFDWARIQSMLK